MTNLLNISSVAAETIAADSMQLVCRWKDTDKRPISAANRVRAVVLPANIWGDATAAAGENKQFALFISDALTDLAKQYLSTIVEESNWQRTQVPAESFTLAALLNWQTEQAAISGRLNSDEIKQWLSSSATIAAVSAAHGAAIAKALGEQLAKLAGPNHGLTPEKAGKILANIWRAEDADSNTGLRVQLRLSAIRDKQQNQQDVLDSIL